MIPIAHITQWRQFAPWPDDLQVEQDLILSRMIIEIFSDPFLSKELAFRGGTALHKLFFNPSARYSEDIDLVRTSTGPIKNIIDRLRNYFDPWLGQPAAVQRKDGFRLNYFFISEGSNSKTKIKVEINTRETFSVLNYLEKDFSVNSNWFVGNTPVRTFQFEELIATKLRALYQRKKGRDLFDLWLALKEKDLDTLRAVHIFQQYIKKQSLVITRKDFEKNLEGKLQENAFLDDIDRLLSPNLRQAHAKPRVVEEGGLRITEDGKIRSTEGWNLIDAAEEIRDKILIHL